MPGLSERGSEREQNSDDHQLMIMTMTAKKKQWERVLVPRFDGILCCAGAVS